MEERLKQDFLSQLGVYFLRKGQKWYIGETEELSTRLKQHINKNVLDSITIATYKSHLDMRNKEQIRDIESILISKATEMGLELDNSKEEKRKVQNSIFDLEDNEKYAGYIWDKMVYSNLSEILSEARYEKLSTEAEKLLRTSKKASEKVKVSSEVESEKISKQLQNEGTIKSKDIRERYGKHKFDLPIFSLVPKRAQPEKYLMTKRVVFVGEYAKECLFLYLYEGLSLKPIDLTLTANRVGKGYISAATLAWYGIETNGNAKGILKSEDPIMAKKLINELVEESGN